MKKRWLRDLYLHKRWYAAMGICAFLFLISFFILFVWNIAVVCLLLVIMLTIADYLLLFAGQARLNVQRIVRDRIHLGEENRVEIGLLHNFPFTARIDLIDELPVQFQRRDFMMSFVAAPGKKQSRQFNLRPTTRGVYTFGHLICFFRTPLQLLQRRIIVEQVRDIKVYPSTRFLRKYQLLALSDSNQIIGSKKVRRLGHSMEFEQIKDYVVGDDMRSINWKATARKGSFMVNSYTDARSQQIYCVIDKGRTMKMPFDEMSLLDHSINAALVLLYTALVKQDKAGLVTFSSRMGEMLPAERNKLQMHKLQEALYKQETDFADSSFEKLTVNLLKKIANRSCLILFTNFETLSSLQRQLPYLRQLAGKHLLCVVFFQNTLLEEIHQSRPDTLEGIYIKTIAERFDFEKKQIVRELRQHGILSVLTTPQNLTVDIVNKYLELKARQIV